MTVRDRRAHRSIETLSDGYHVTPVDQETGARPPASEMTRLMNETPDSFRRVFHLLGTQNPDCGVPSFPRLSCAGLGRVPSAQQLQEELLAPELARLYAETCGAEGPEYACASEPTTLRMSRDETEHLTRVAHSAERETRRGKRTLTL